MKTWYLVLVLSLALGLRLYQLEADSLWEDEIFTATQSPLPLADLLDWTAGDIHPPGYYLAVGRLADWLGWAHLPPSALTDWLWRFPSVLAGTLAIAVTFRLGTDLLGQRVGLAAALLLAASPIAIQYSQEARMHELFLLATALSTWTLARALARPRQAGWWLAYALATALSLYTVYLAFVVLAAQAGWVSGYQIAKVKQQTPLIKRRDPSGKYQVYGWLAGVALALALYLPWWRILLSIVSQRLAIQGNLASIGDVETGVGPPWAFLVKGIYSLGPAPGWPAWLFFGLWAVGLASVLLRRKLALALLGGLWLALPLALPLVFQDPRALHARYVFLLPVYLVFVAQGWMWLGAQACRLATDGWRSATFARPKSGELRNREAIIQRVFVASVSGLVLISLLYLPGYYRRTKPDWRGVAVYLEKWTIPGDAVVTGPLFDVGRFLDYYYEGPAELMPPAVLVASLPNRVASMRASGGRVWAVTRFRPVSIPATKSIPFSGVIVSEPLVAIYEPELITTAMIDLMRQAVAAAPGWAAEMSASGVMEPDPLVARAAAYLFLGDVYQAAGHLPEAVVAYEAMVVDDPASAGGYVTLATAYEAVGQLDAAVRAYQRAVALNPSWQGGEADAAASLAVAGLWSEAAAAYRAIVK